MIVITTPTGQIGRQVLGNVLKSGKPIRVIVRDPSRLPSEARKRIDVVQGSHGDSDTVQKAFAGADTVFWLVPPDPKAESVEAAYVGFSRPAGAAFKSQGVKRVVGISALGRGTPWAANAGLVMASLKMDDLIASTGVNYRAVINPSFMDNLLRQVQVIKSQGAFFLPISGDLKQPSACTRDIAATAAKLLLDDSWSGVASNPVLGPEDNAGQQFRGGAAWHLACDGQTGSNPVQSPTERCDQHTSTRPGRRSTGRLLRDTGGPSRAISDADA